MIAEWVKYVVGFMIGVGLPPAAIWLLVVYPYGEISLRKFWVGLGFGFLFSVTAIFGAMVWWSCLWSRD